mmetsp:Transcript_57682/g.148389  ORF Transcript_57682/g.148389 Transcript_57682/m.148389 type:complete len:360 (-) Transcript_57682:219-1298(-)
MASAQEPNLASSLFSSSGPQLAAVAAVAEVLAPLEERLYARIREVESVAESLHRVEDTADKRCEALEVEFRVMTATIRKMADAQEHLQAQNTKLEATVLELGARLDKQEPGARSDDLNNSDEVHTHGTAWRQAAPNVRNHWTSQRAQVRPTHSEKSLAFAPQERGAATPDVSKSLSVQERPATPYVTKSVPPGGFESMAEAAEAATRMVDGGSNPPPAMPKPAGPTLLKRMGPSSSVHQQLKPLISTNSEGRLASCSEVSMLSPTGCDGRGLSPPAGRTRLPAVSAGGPMKRRVSAGSPLPKLSVPHHGSTPRSGLSPSNLRRLHTVSSAYELVSHQKNRASDALRNAGGRSPVGRRSP